MDSKESQADTETVHSDDTYSEITIPVEEAAMFFISEDVNRRSPNLQRPDSSDAFTFLEDIEPPSLLESSCDNCPLHNSTANSMYDKIQQEKLVSLNSTDDKFGSYLLSNSRQEASFDFGEPAANCYFDSKQISTIGARKSETCDDSINKAGSSTSTAKDNTGSDAQTATRLNTADLPSFSCEVEALRVMKRLLRTSSSTTTVDECESCPGLDQISDSILQSFSGSSSREDSVFLSPNNKTEVCPTPIKAKVMGDSYIVNNDNDIPKAILDSICGENEKPPNIQNETVHISNPLIVESVQATTNGDSTFNKMPNRSHKVNRTFDKYPTGDVKSEVADCTVALAGNNLTRNLEQANSTVVLARNDITRDLEQANVSVVLAGNNVTRNMETDMETGNATVELANPNITRDLEEPNDIVVLTRKNLPGDLPANTTVELGNPAVGKDLEENLVQEESVQELNNGKFLMRGEEFNLMDMEISDLRSVLSQTNNSRRSLQNMESPKSNCTKRISLTGKRNSLKGCAKPNENKLLKKLDINQFSSMNLFKGKLRGAALKKTEERKGPMKATYVPYKDQLEDKPMDLCTPRAVSSPAGTQLRHGSKSDGEYSGPPMPSFGSVSTIDSDRPSTPDLGDTPEVIRGKGVSSRMTSTPSMKFDIVNALTMPDFPTPILAPGARPALRKISESLSTSGCDEAESSLENVKNAKNERSNVSSSSKGDVTLTKKSAAANCTAIINNAKTQVRPPPSIFSGGSKAANKTAKVDKENLNQSKTKRASISGLPLKGRVLNRRRASNIHAPVVNKPLTKLPASRNTGRLVPKTGPSLAPKPLIPRTQLSQQQPNKSLKPPIIARVQPPTITPRVQPPPITPRVQPPTITARVQPPPRRPLCMPVHSVKVTNNKGIPLPKPISASVKVACDSTTRTDVSKRCSVIPRPSFKPKQT